MATYLQADRPLKVTTPLGPDDLLLIGLAGHEGISRLFSFQLDLLAENRTDIAFDKLLGKNVISGLSLPNGNRRYFSGICSRISQVSRDSTFTTYRMEVVPGLWLFTRRVCSRIFQQMTVPDILSAVLDGLDMAQEIQGTFEPRDYCVQYRESDFAFVSRLMEEEGIYYFFRHTDQGHTLVLANTPDSHADMPEGSTIQWESITGGLREDERIRQWEKTQELRSGKVTLWDHCFELPHKHLEADQPTQDSVSIGRVTHKLKVGGNDKFEIYQYPGEYAQRFDGVDPGGGDRAGDLQKIFQDNQRTADIRMQQETVPAIVINASSDCRNLVSGYKFTLERHFNADGQYLVTSVVHSANLRGNYRSGGATLEMLYENQFTCIPLALPFRPPRITPKPTVHGTQTAVVVGPAGEEIFTDKYGRVKAQFHWDREGEYSSDSSCWMRVAQPLAGKGWGAIYIPRIGQEVVVAFEEGDPDRPIIVGSVYNASEMPPYTLPDQKTKTVIFKSDSSPHKPGFNEIRIEDKKGEEQVFIHGEKDQDIRIKKDRREFIGRDRHLHVERHKREHVKGSSHILIGGDLLEQVGGDNHQHIKGKQVLKVGETLNLDVADEISINCSSSIASFAVGEHNLVTQDKLILQGNASVTLKCGGSFIKVDPGGISISGPLVKINSGGSPENATPGSSISPTAPAVAELADQADPGSKASSYKQQRAALSPVEIEALEAAAHDPNSEESKQKKSWIEIELIDEEKNPVPGERYQVTLPDGTTIASGTLDAKGYAKVDHIDPGTCKITFPDLDKDAWEPVGQGGGGGQAGGGGQSGSGATGAKGGGGQSGGGSKDGGSTDTGSKKDSGDQDVGSEKDSDYKGSEDGETEYKVGYDEEYGLPQAYPDSESKGSEDEDEEPAKKDPWYSGD